jgi:hypothetical protein
MRKIRGGRGDINSRAAGVVAAIEANDVCDSADQSELPTGHLTDPFSCTPLSHLVDPFKIRPEGFKKIQEMLFIEYHYNNARRLICPRPG